MTFYSRKSARIPNFDYSSCNYYFVTICTGNRRCIFGSPNILNRYGKIAEEEILKIPSHYEGVIIDKYVVMPNHVHMIVILENGNYNLNQIIAQYKSGVTRWIRKCMPDVAVWQRSYHDHVIRNQAAYEKIWLYIEANPKNWDQDCFYLDPNIG